MRAEARLLWAGRMGDQNVAPVNPATLRGQLCGEEGRVGVSVRSERTEEGPRTFPSWVDGAGGGARAHLTIDWKEGLTTQEGQRKSLERVPQVPQRAGWDRARSLGEDLAGIGSRSPCRVVARQRSHPGSAEALRTWPRSCVLTCLFLCVFVCIAGLIPAPPSWGCSEDYVKERAEQLHGKR